MMIFWVVFIIVAFTVMALIYAKLDLYHCFTEPDLLRPSLA